MAEADSENLTGKISGGTPPPDRKGKGLTDEELLVALYSERRQSAGFEEDAILLKDREQALNYIKGEMPDLPAIENRSKAISTDVADAIETLLPDLIEVFTDGDDVLAFTPNGPQDEDQAEQETDYVKHVIFSENDGVAILYDIFKDALSMKIGVVTAWWEAREDQVEEFEGKTLIEVLLAGGSSKLEDLKEDGKDDQGQPTYSFTATQKQRGRCKIAVIPPEDFTVARDTPPKLGDAAFTYCAWRARPRAQQLIMEGIDRDKVDALPAYGTTYDETLRLARDQAGEYADMRSVTGFHDLRQVEVLTHFIMIDYDGEGPALWKVRTGNAETILIDAKKLSRLDVASVTPFRNPHRFYGESLADKTIETQRQKTALKRMLLDSGYFALNQRTEVSMEKANQWTISDLMRNEPMMPVRSKTGDAVRALEAGQINFDILAALEFSSVEAETRTGVVRNANGLAPDTLHQTAHGMLALLQAAQKRPRMMAVMMAHTGLKDLYLIVHDILREHADVEHVVKLRGKDWVPVSPTDWDERDAMTIQVGGGSAGKAQEVEVLTAIAEQQAKIIEGQMAAGNPTGPVVTPENVYNLMSRIAEKSGEKTPDLFFTDPGPAMQAAAQNPQGKPPNPEAIKAESQERMHGQKLQQEGQYQQAQLFQAQQQAVAQHDLERQKFQADQQERVARIELEARQAASDDAFRHAQLASQERIKIAEITARGQQVNTQVHGAFATATTVQSMKDANDAQQRAVDVHTDAMKSQDAAEIAEADRQHDAEQADADRDHQADLADKAAKAAKATAAKSGD